VTSEVSEVLKSVRVYKDKKDNDVEKSLVHHYLRTHSGTGLYNVKK
jgi:hypothetical protein